jgi:putative transposase
VFRFVQAEKANHPIATMCRVLGVSTSGYYAWRGRGPSKRARRDAEITGKLVVAHQRSRGTYGAPSLHADLAADGERCGRKRVARLMCAAGLQGVHRRRGIRTTRQDKNAAPAPDLLERDFTATAPDHKWVADITYVPTWSGFVYLAVVLDCFSRRVVGWAMASHLRTELVLDALDMALWNRRPHGVIHHSDRGCQYTSWAFGRRCHEAGVVPSIGSVGDAYDNALCESFFASLECELIDRSVFRNRNDARVALFDYIECFYNRARRHSALGYLWPAEFERRHGRAGADPDMLLVHPRPEIGSQGLSGPSFFADPPDSAPTGHQTVATDPTMLFDREGGGRS